MTSINYVKDKSTFAYRLVRCLIYTILILFALYFLAPIVVMIITSVKPLDEIKNGTLISFPEVLTFTPWLKAWSEACIGTSCSGVQPYFVNSILITLPAVFISCTLGALNGYVFSKWNFKGSNIIFASLLFGCFIPFQVILLPISKVIGITGLSGSIWALIFVHIIYGLPFTTLFFRNFYMGIPTDLINAAKVDGANFFTIFYKVLLPISTPIFMVCIIWQMTQIWNDFLFAVVISGAESQPVTVALNNLTNATAAVKEYNVEMAAAIIAVAPTLIAYLVSGKYFVKGLTAGAVKG